jgi:dihydrofolate reductase / thymidylate synthase
MISLKLIVAKDIKNGIGKNQDMPWHLRKELSYFKKITTESNNKLLKNVVIMGRKTWESIPESFRPLKGRINIILSRTTKNTNTNDIFFSDSINSALKLLETLENINKENIFIIGGASIYKETLSRCNTLYITEIYKDFDCDTFFHAIPNEFKLTTVSNFIEDNNIYFRHITYTKENTLKEWTNLEEESYLECMRKIINSGIKKIDRTGVGTLSLFGEMFKYNLRDTFPALTTRRQFLRGIFEELKFYMIGKTDNTILNDKNVTIWNGNTSRSFLDKRGLSHYPEGDMGETYGFNFRHYGAEYKTCKDDYTNKGFDQLNYAINLIKTNPTSRRIIIDIWNCSTLDKAALPPCLCKYQFYVNTNKNELDLIIYLRSSDFFLANNWNVCTGAFLVHMVCNLKDIELTPGILTVITADTHLYLNHLDQVNLNLERRPKPFPKLIIKEKKERLEDFEFTDMTFLGYNPDKSISAKMAV